MLRLKITLIYFTTNLHFAAHYPLLKVALLVHVLFIKLWLNTYVLHVHNRFMANTLRRILQRNSASTILSYTYKHILYFIISTLCLKYAYCYKSKCECILKIIKLYNRYNVYQYKYKKRSYILWYFTIYIIW